jgi:PTH1 family peptidyl-tRNA hydrolase
MPEFSKNHFLKQLFKQAPMAIDWLVVGLGNPGKQYTKTPHNIGFAVVEALAQQRGFSFKAETKASAPCEWGSYHLAGQQVLVVKPHTFMNLSGNVVGPLVKGYGLPPSRLLVVLDEVNLPLGKMRLRAEGSAGGQNGMKHIIQHLGTEAFYRLRLGIGPQPEGMPLEAFVLRPYTAEASQALPPLLQQATHGLETLMTTGLAAAQKVLGAPAL